MKLGEPKNDYIGICIGHPLRFRMRSESTSLIHQIIYDIISNSIRTPLRNLTDNRL